MRSSLLLIAILCAPAQGRGQNRITLDDLLSLRLGDYPQQISPDGALLAYSESSTIYLIAAKTGKMVSKVGKGYIPMWSPDGRRLAYYADGPTGFQLWLFNVATSAKEQLTSLVGGIDPSPLTAQYGYYVWSPLQFSWSSDGTRIAFASQVISVGSSTSSETYINAAKTNNDPDSPLVLDDNTPPERTLSGIFSKAFPQVKYWAFWESKRSEEQIARVPAVNQIFVVDLLSKTIKQITHDDAGYSSPAWSPDGEELACVSQEGRSLASSTAASNIYVIDIATGRKKALTIESQISKGAPLWSPDGKKLAFVGRPRSGDRRLFVISRVGGSSLEIPGYSDRSVGEFLWLPDSKSVIAEYASTLVKVDASNGGIELLNEFEPAERRFITVSNRGTLAWQQSDSSSASVIRILPAGSRSSYVLYDLNPQIKTWPLGKQEVVHWRNRQGREMEGILIKPATYHEGAKYPLIVDVYPVHTNGFKADPMAGNQAWASKGYAIFMPITGAPHFSRGFRSEPETQGPKGWDITIDNIMSGVDELVRRGIVDPNRMGLYGFSNGGGIVNFLVTRTSRFKCAVSVAGSLADWLRPALMHTAMAPFFAQLEGGPLVWDDVTPYLQSSAVFYLGRVSTPMLLADGDADGDFLLDSIEMYNGLRHFGRDVILLRYPDQAHGFTGLALKDFWAREDAYFDKYLSPNHSLE